MSRLPDAQIFPHATGAAAKTVEQHTAPQDIVFWSGWVRLFYLCGVNIDETTVLFFSFVHMFSGAGSFSRRRAYFISIKK